MIYYDFRRELSQQHSTFGDETPSVYDWFTEYNRGRRSLTDEFREGRPKSVAVPQNIEVVRELIL